MTSLSLAARKIQESKMPNLYMLVGEPGCGKSYWTDKNAAKLDAVVISTDVILYEYMERDGISYGEAFDQFIGNAGKEMNIRVRQAMNKGQNIIWDQTNLTSKGRTRKLKQFEGKYHKTAVLFNILPEVIDRQLKLRESQGGKHISKWISNKMRAFFVSPSKEEGFDKITVVR